MKARVRAESLVSRLNASFGSPEKQKDIRDPVGILLELMRTDDLKTNVIVCYTEKNDFIENGRTRRFLLNRFEFYTEILQENFFL